VKPEVGLRDRFPRVQLRVGEQVVNGVRYFVQLKPDAGCGVPLPVEINQQDAQPHLNQYGPEVNRRRALTGATLVHHDGDDLSHWNVGIGG
jgi:hypothetical protein